MHSIPLTSQICRVPSNMPPPIRPPSWLYAQAVTAILPGLANWGLITVFCSTFQVSHTRIDPSSLLVIPVYLSVGCHCACVQGLMWPFVFLRSLMYMSPATLTPRSLPSRSYTLIWEDPVATRKASPVAVVQLAFASMTFSKQLWSHLDSNSACKGNRKWSFAQLVQRLAPLFCIATEYW